MSNVTLPQTDGIAVLGGQMLISPIEITTEAFSRAQVQQLYYGKERVMRTVLGPKLPESELVQGSSNQRQVSAANFDHTIALVAPPLLFQVAARPVYESRGECDVITEVVQGVVFQVGWLGGQAMVVMLMWMSGGVGRREHGTQGAMRR